MNPQCWGVRYFYIPVGRWCPKRIRDTVERSVDDFIRLATDPRIAAVRLYEPGHDGEDYLWEDQRPDPIAQLALRTISITYVESLVRQHFGIPRAAMLGPGRYNKLAHIRQIAMALAMEYCRTSKVAIGRHFKRHHTTVIHAVEVMPRNESNPALSVAVATLRRDLDHRRGTLPHAPELVSLR